MGTTIMGVTELRRRTGEVLDEIGEEEKTVYVTRYGRPVAVLVDYDHYERLKAASEPERAESEREPSYPRPGMRHPTVVNEPASLREWMDLIPDGCGGDALADTEALYDEV
jgi:prevent-host-death family protein